MDILLNPGTIGMDLRTSQGSTLGFTFGNVTDILIHERPITADDPKATPPIVPRRVTGQPMSGVVKLKWNQEMVTNKATRALLSQSATLFTQLNKKRSTSNISTSEMVKTSRKYRSVIHATTESIVVEDDSSLELFKMMSNIEMVWHLCEILFIDSHPPGVLLNQLMSWIRWHLNHKTAIAAEQVLKCGRDPTDHPHFWKVLYHFIFSGQMDQVKDWINLYRQSVHNNGHGQDGEPNEEVEKANIVMQVVSKMPMYQFGQLLHEVDMRWSLWSNEVKEIIATGFFTDSPLELVMNLLAGNESSLNNVAARPDHELTWIHLLLAKILFKDPFLKEKDLSSLANEAIDTFGRVQGQTGGRNDLLGSNSVVNKTLQAAFSYDLMQVVHESCKFNDNWWFAAHFVDLLNCGDNLTSHGIESEQLLRDFLLLDFADNLMSHESLWTLAIDYYDYSGQQQQQMNSSGHQQQEDGQESRAIVSNGRYRLELMLERIPLKSEATAFKILDIANKRNLKSLTKSICRTMAQSWIKKGNLSSALTWSLKSEDANVSSFIATQMLLKYSLIQSGPSIRRSASPSFGSQEENDEKLASTVIDSDILSSLGPSMLVSEKLTFLAKYYELKQLMKRPSLMAEAIQLLISLINSKISPPFFLITLLADSVSLMEEEDHFVRDANNRRDASGDANQDATSSFDSENCCTLLGALESLIDLRTMSKRRKLINETSNKLASSSSSFDVINNSLLMMSDEEFERKEMEIRVAVNSCLARNIVV